MCAAEPTGGADPIRDFVAARSDENVTVVGPKASDGLQVLVVGAFGNGNFGDDALIHGCKCILSLVLERDAFGFRVSTASYLSSLFPGLRMFPPGVKIPAADLLLFGGGTQFASFELTRERSGREWARRFLKALREPTSALRVLDARRSRPPRSAAIGLGLGPFVRASVEERRARSLIGRMSFVAVRDVQSAAICSAWGMHSYVAGTDLCFHPRLWKQRFESRLTVHRRRIAIIPRDWHHTHSGALYTEPLRAAITELSKTAEVSFVCFCRTGDAEWLRWLSENRIRHHVWEPTVTSIEAFAVGLAEYDLFITARYHGAVFAALCSKPFVAIEIEPKLKLVQELFREGSALWPQPFSSEQLVRQVSRIFSEHQTFADNIARMAKGQSEIAETVAERFLRYVGTLRS